MGNRRDWSKVGEIVEKVRELGLTLKDGAERFGIKVGLLYEFNRRKKTELKLSQSPAPAGTGEESEKDTRKRSVQLPEEVQERIRAYRREKPANGFKRIADLLKQKHLVVVTRKQIRKVLKESGLLETCDSSFDKGEEESKGVRRFEARYAGEIWQMDVAYVYIRKIPVLYLVVIVDDHSRFCVAAELREDQRADTLMAVLHDACVAQGAPKKLLTDQGSGFYSWSGEQTRFQEYLDDRSIEHIVAEPHRPQSQGKVERLIQTLRVELLSRVKFTGLADARARIQSFIASYNFERPHQGIQGKRPADRFHGIVKEVERVECDLTDRELDLSRGYMVYKAGERRVCVTCSAEGLQVYLDGKLLKEARDGGCEH